MWALRQLPAGSRVLVMPAGDHPFAKELSAAHHRLAMCRLAFDPLGDSYELRSDEIDRARMHPHQPTYTYDTLCSLRRELGSDTPLRLVVGKDQLHETATRWHRWEEVERLAPPIWVPRRGYDGGTDSTAPPEISSTTLRERLRRGENSEPWLAPAVDAYIRSHGLYAGARL